MKSKIITFTLLCSFLAGMPGLTRAAEPATSLLALSATEALPTAQEQAQLSQLGAQNPSLLQQSAGERVLVIEDRRGDRGWGWWGPRRRNGFIIGAIVLTAVVVTLIVLGAQPNPR